MFKWFEDNKRKEAAIKKIYDKMFAKAKGRFVIKCEGKNGYSLFDNEKQKFVYDFKWAGWERHDYGYEDQKDPNSIWAKNSNKNYFIASSIENSKQTVDHIIWTEAMKRFNNLIDHHHRIKNKEVSYT